MRRHWRAWGGGWAAASAAQLYNLSHVTMLPVPVPYTAMILTISVGIGVAVYIFNQEH